MYSYFMSGAWNTHARDTRKLVASLVLRSATSEGNNSEKYPQHEVNMIKLTRWQGKVNGDIWGRLFGEGMRNSALNLNLRFPRRLPKVSYIHLS